MFHVLMAVVALAGPSENPARDCVVENAVRLGGSNTENSETVIRAAWAVCREHVADLEQQARGRALMERYEGARVQIGAEGHLEKSREEINEAASLALLEARAAKE